jgi:transcriptional regulator with GAF, ATPase, and Fis domain
MPVATKPEALIQNVDDLNQKAWEINRADPAGSIKLAEEALIKASEINYPLGIALAKKTIGACYIWTSRNEEGVEYCLEANEIFKDLKDKKNGSSVYVILGTNFFFLSDYDTALKCYKIGHELASKIGEASVMSDGLNGVGTVYYTTEQNDKALEALLEAEKIAKKNEIHATLVKIHDGLGETYFNLKKYDKALLYYKSCIRMCEELKSLANVQAYALDGLGRTYAAMTDFEKAIAYYEESLKIRKETGFKVGEAITLHNIGKLYDTKKDTASAINYISEAYELSKKVGSKEGMYKASESLAEIFEKQGKTQEALEYLKLCYAAKDEARQFRNIQMTKSFELQNRVLQTAAEKAIFEEKAKELENFNESLTLMSQLGQQIISTLSVETIVNTAHRSINDLMDATGFGVGIYHQADNAIDFPSYIEGDEVFTDIRYDLEEENRLTVLCFKKSMDIVVNDYDTDIVKFIKKVGNPLAGRHVESLIYVPLKYKDSVLGVVTVQSFKKHAYTNYHLNILKNLATYIAIALENARLYQEQELTIEERTKELVQSKEEVEKASQINKKIYEIGRHITSNLNLKSIFGELYQRVNEIMPAEIFGVRIYHDDSKTVEYRFEIENGVLSEESHVIPLTDDNNYTVWCIKNRKDIFLNDNKLEYTKYVKQIRVVSGDMPNSLLFTPMILGEKLIGVITVQSFLFQAYTPAHLEILRTLATYTATALENAWLYENMESKVNKRTSELKKQFEHTALLSTIGKDITSTFSTEEIVDKVYSKVNSLMEATGFGIGVFKKETDEILFPLYIEGDDKFEHISDFLHEDHSLSVICFKKREEIVINDFSTEILKYRESNDGTVKHGRQVSSLIYLPLLVKDNCIGVITVQSFNTNAYSDYHVQMLKGLSVYVAIALDNASLYAGMEKRVEERTKEIEKNYEDTRLIGEISKELSSSLSKETIIDSVYKSINGLMKANAFGIALYNKQSGELEFKGFRENGMLLPDFNLPATDINRLGPVCFIKKQEIIINDFFNEYTKYIQLAQAPVAGNVSESIIYLPLYAKNDIIGVITVQASDKNAYTNYQVSILRNLTVFIGIALDNASLYFNMEEKVNSRTMEVVQQKEEIEKASANTRLVSEIGKEITSTFSIEEIIKKVYDSVNQMMDAAMFGIGIYDEESRSIRFSGAIEKGEMLEDYNYNLTEVNRPAIMCFKSQEPIVIGNFVEEFIKSQKVESRESLPGVNPDSIIYLPLSLKEKKIGVITVQSFTVNAYSDYHVQLLKSLAIYTAIAIDNAGLYSRMEDRVEERTKEITTAYENTRLLGQIAEDISSALSVETIISKVYENVNKLMDATMFGMGVFNPANGKLEFSGFIENDEIMPDFSYQADDPDRLAAYCFTNEKDILINDYSKEYMNYIQGMKAPVSGKDSASIVYIPLYSKDVKIGVFTVQSFDKDVYTDYHFNILRSLAVSIGIALDNANLYQNLEEKVKGRTLEVIKQKEQIEKTFEDQRTLTKIGNDITSTLSIEEIIDKVYAKITSLMDATCFGVGLFNKDRGKIVYPLLIEGDDKFSCMVYDVSERDRLNNLCYGENRDIIINDFNAEVENFVERSKTNTAGGLDTQSLIFLPMSLKEKVIGVIAVQSMNKNAYTDYHVQILKNLAVYIAIAIDNASLYQNMEDMVQERTKEVIKQKETIEKNFNDVKLSAEIAKVIASSLSVETIVSQVYESLQSIVKSESFGIGMYDPETDMIGFSGFIEKGEKLPYVQVSMDDKERYAVMCFENEMEIVINDHAKEYSKYTKSFKKSLVGETPESLVYIPLFTKEKKIGVLTAQCFSKNAYQDYHVNILRNMALSIAIAIDNANLYQNLEAKVAHRTAEVQKQKAIIEEKNKDITDSIRYAKKIQQAIAPNIDDFNRNFVDSFILFKPKDIVSGDFFWFDHHEKGTTVFAAADCTGHGVPGAFMSLICMEIMYKVITDQKTTEPAKALMGIDERLVSLVKKSSEASANDGMDIALCTYVKAENKFMYAGAHRPLIMIRNNELVEYKPSKFSIGGHSTEGKAFELNVIDTQPGDIFYLLTDGYADQFGGDDGKKFKFKNFKSLVMSISGKPMKEQRVLLDEAFEAWKGSLEQIDDVCVIGVKV